MPDLGELIDDFLAHTPGDRQRELRGPLAHVVASALAVRDAADVSGEDVDTLVADLTAAGVPPERTDAVVEALRLVFAHGIAHGGLRASPLVGFAAAPASAAPSPTTAILALGEHVVAWTTRAVVVGFVLAAIGLLLALA
jgi:TRAP-type C4-dicarboxylate transport system permease small subunit